MQKIHPKETGQLYDKCIDHAHAHANADAHTRAHADRSVSPMSLTNLPTKFETQRTIILRDMMFFKKNLNLNFF